MSAMRQRDSAAAGAREAVARSVDKGIVAIVVMQLVARRVGKHAGIARSGLPEFMSIGVTTSG